MKITTSRDEIKAWSKVAVAPEMLCAFLGLIAHDYNGAAYIDEICEDYWVERDYVMQMTEDAERYGLGYHSVGDYLVLHFDVQDVLLKQAGRQ